MGRRAGCEIGRVFGLAAGEGPEGVDRQKLYGTGGGFAASKGVKGENRMSIYG